MDGNAMLMPRRFGIVNWVGIVGLAERQIRSGLSTINYTVLGPVVSNALYLLIFLTVARTTMDQSASDNLMAWIAPGLIAFSIAEKSYEASGANLIFEKHNRVHYDWMMAPITSLEKIACFAFSSSLCGLVVGVAVTLVMFLFAWLPFSHPWAIIAFGIGTGAFHGMVGTLLGIWAEKWDQYSAIHTFVLLPLSFLSGVFNNVSQLPEYARRLISLNPIYYMIDGFRFGMTGKATVDPFLSLAIVAFSSLFLAAIAYSWLARGYRLKT